jgi:hypothetical protein
VANLVLVGVNSVFLTNILSWKLTLLVVISGLLSAAFLYQLCFVLGARGLKRFCSDICEAPNQMYFATMEKGAKASQPSRLHKYWIMVMDLSACSPDAELSVTGNIDRRYQKYWSLVVYDRYGLPLPQYVYDASVVEMPMKSDPENPDRYSFDIRLRRMQPSGGVDDTRPAGVTDVDVSSASVGYVLFRLVHPSETCDVDDDHICSFSTPTATLLNGSGFKELKKDQ